jgi:hypothetical protein
MRREAQHSFYFHPTNEGKFDGHENETDESHFRQWQVDAGTVAAF